MGGVCASQRTAGIQVGPADQLQNVTRCAGPRSQWHRTAELPRNTPRRRPPRAVTADRGYGEACVEADLRDLGISTLAIPHKVTTSPTRRATEHRPGTTLALNRSLCSRAMCPWADGPGRDQAERKGLPRLVRRLTLDLSPDGVARIFHFSCSSASIGSTAECRDARAGRRDFPDSYLPGTHGGLGRRADRHSPRRTRPGLLPRPP